MAALVWLHTNTVFALTLVICHGYMQAALKAVCRVQRYEALPHRQITLELALHHFAMGKYSRAPDLLAQTWHHSKRRIQQLETELAALLQQATDLGFAINPVDAFQLADQGALLWGGGRCMCVCIVVGWGRGGGRGGALQGSFLLMHTQLSRRDIEAHHRAEVCQKAGCQGGV